MKIITNNIPRPLFALADIPAAFQGDFSYITGDDRSMPRFVMYKNDWYDVHDTQAIRTAWPPGNPCGTVFVVSSDSPLAGWDCVASDSYFSGLVFRFVGDEVVVGRYMV